MHQRLNNNLLSIGEAVITTPPLPEAVGAVVLASFTISPGAAAIPLTFAPTVPAGTSVKVFATAPMSPGKSFVKSEYRQIAVLAPAVLTGADQTVPYIARFGNGAAAGQKVFFKFLPINMSTGQAGAVSSAEAIVA
ncbi:MAG: hypothetical protein JJE49_03955 [Peptostreptococcaceae bacterium]|nr:hypothetical protein [Peptostreptococcaceae bacterium]